MKKLFIKLQNTWRNFLKNHPTLAKYFGKINKVAKKLEIAVTFTISLLGLLVTYFIGFGLTKLVAFLVGKKFLETKNKKTQWSKAKYINSFNESMY